MGKALGHTVVYPDSRPWSVNIAINDDLLAKLSHLLSDHCGGFGSRCKVQSDRGESGGGDHV